MKTVDFLDAIKRRRALPSDYALAKLLGWRQTRISMYRHTERELDDDGCIQVAAALEMPPEYVMACIAAVRAKSTEARRAWVKAAKMLKTGTAAAIMGAALFLSAPPSAKADGATADSLYILSNKGKVRRRRDVGANQPRLERRHQRRPRPPQMPLLRPALRIVA